MRWTASDDVNISGMTAAVLWLGLKTVNESVPISLYDEVCYDQC